MNETEKLKEISAFFQRMNAKIMLITLITKAKKEIERYDLESGRKSLEEAFSLDPENPAVLRGLGCVEQAEGKYEIAIEYYKKALKFSEEKEVEHTLIGTAYYFQDKLDEAVKYFNLAIDENDDYDPAYEGRNQAMLENHLKIVDLQEALKKYF